MQRGYHANRLETRIEESAAHASLESLTNGKLSAGGQCGWAKPLVFCSGRRGESKPDSRALQLFSMCAHPAVVSQAALVSGWPADSNSHRALGNETGL